MTGLGTVAFVGDSLTENGHWQDWFPDDTVQNFGVGGSTSDDVIERLPDIISTHPDTVIVVVGTNDLAWRRSVEHIVRNIETILVTIRRDLPDARILVQSVLPRGNEFAEQIRDVNRHIWQFAPTLRAQYLDLWPALALPDGELNPSFSEDRLHLNDEGYQVWLTELRPALETLANQPPASRAITLPNLS
jgi:lysophospholipase L1-like esterase